MLKGPQAVQAQADRMGFSDGSDAQRLRSLVDSLVPMVRCALRTGRGHPRLVGWVRQALPSVLGPHHSGGPVDPDRTAWPLARLLCSALLDQAQSDLGRGMAVETIVGY